MPQTHVVKQGECLSLIAASYGFPDYTVVYNDPANQELRKKRPNPDLLYPGDEISIPDLKTKSVDLATGKTHTIVVRSPKRHLRLVLKGSDGKPLADKPFHLEAGDLVVDGTTTADGEIDEALPVHHEAVKLSCDGLEWELNLGALNPVTDIDDDDASAVQTRLANLGYEVEVTGEWDDQLKVALETFQLTMGLPQTGEFDADTEKALIKAYGT
ncbi:MAG: peptidoglycan-binding protein [Archangium sp.]|nr:peptidoglycan-binding protein [Archangium sp.]